LLPAITEILFAVGAGDRVVGVTTYCNYPEQVNRLEKVGGFSAESISAEKIITLKPDAVFAGGSFHDSIRRSLEPAGIRVYQFNALNMEELYKQLADIGRICRGTEEAERLIRIMSAREEKLKKMAAEYRPERPYKIFWEVWDEPLITAGPGSFIGQFIEAAGAENIFKDVKKDFAVINSEELVRRNPDYIMGPQSHSSKVSFAQLASRPGMADVNAVKNKKIYFFDDDIISRPGPRIISGFAMIVKTLYPEGFEKIFPGEDPALW
jgi:iron complex transport system substrate-binding protein